uniref:carbohydrate ABC transporter permease n=1 Tax=Paenibacillus sp. FSL R5-0749 TaxID=2921657 RepID=UPI00406C94FB
MSYSASCKKRTGRFVIYAIVIMLALICLLPLWNIVAISFSSSEAVSANAVGLVPVNFTTAAYTKIIDDAQFWRSFGISVLRVALALVLNMILIILMAYPLSKSKREFKGRNIYMNIMIFAMLFSGGMIPTYLLIKNLDMLNTIWALVLPGAVPIFSVILVMNFFSAVPKALEEAAFIDGANPLQVLFKVYVPVSIPALATVALFSIVGTWNDFFSGLIYMTKVSNYPLMTYIQSLNVNIADLLQAGTNSSELSNLTEISNKNLNAAKIVVAVIPLLLIYPLLQKYFVTGIVVGSVKE